MISRVVFPEGVLNLIDGIAYERVQCISVSVKVFSNLIVVFFIVNKTFDFPDESG